MFYLVQCDYHLFYFLDSRSFFALACQSFGLNDQNCCRAALQRLPKITKDYFEEVLQRLPDSVLTICRAGKSR